MARLERLLLELDANEIAAQQAAQLERQRQQVGGQGQGGLEGGLGSRQCNPVVPDREEGEGSFTLLPLVRWDVKSTAARSCPCNSSPALSQMPLPLCPMSGAVHPTLRVPQEEAARADEAERAQQAQQRQRILAALRAEHERKAREGARSRPL